MSALSLAAAAATLADFGDANAELLAQHPVNHAALSRAGESWLAELQLAPDPDVAKWRHVQAWATAFAATVTDEVCRDGKSRLLAVQFVSHGITVHVWTYVDAGSTRPIGWDHECGAHLEASPGEAPSATCNRRAGHEGAHGNAEGTRWPMAAVADDEAKAAVR